MGWKQWESSAFQSACRKGSKRWTCHTDMSTPAWISTNHECRKNDRKERRGRGCKCGWALGCATREKKWRLAPKKLHSLCAGLGQGAAAGAWLAPWKQGSKSWKPSQPGQETARYALGAGDTVDTKWIESRVDRCSLKAKLRAEARWLF